MLTDYFGGLVLRVLQAQLLQHSPRNRHSWPLLVPPAGWQRAGKAVLTSILQRCAPPLGALKHSFKTCSRATVALLA